MWQDINTAPEGVEIDTCIIDKNGQRNNQTLVKQGKLFYTRDRRMYVYYTPTHWQQLGAK